MGRFRSPPPAGSKYITPAGARRLRSELEQLWRDERPRVTQAVAAAAAQGDRSENAEYIYGKRRLREIDRRVRFLRQRLAGMVIVDRTARRIRGGCSSAPGCRSRPRTGAQRATASSVRMSSTWPSGYISMDSPLGRALLRRALDEEVTVEAPGGSRVYVIVVDRVRGRVRPRGAAASATRSPARS